MSCTRSKCKIVSRVHPGKIAKGKKPSKKRLFANVMGNLVVGCETQSADLYGHIWTSLTRNQGSSISLFGPPGVGKTFTVNAFINKLGSAKKALERMFNRRLSIAKLDGNRVSSSKIFLDSICEALDIKQGRTLSSSKKLITQHVLRNDNPSFVILFIEEFDLVLGRRGTCATAKWIRNLSSTMGSSLLLICTQNRQIDGCNVDVIFPPYGELKLALIGANYLKQRKLSRQFTPESLPLLCSQVANLSGDCRSLFSRIENLVNKTKGQVTPAAVTASQGMGISHRMHLLPKRDLLLLTFVVLHTIKTRVQVKKGKSRPPRGVFEVFPLSEFMITEFNVIAPKLGLNRMGDEFDHEQFEAMLVRFEHMGIFEKYGKITPRHLRTPLSRGRELYLFCFDLEHLVEFCKENGVCRQVWELQTDMVEFDMYG